VIERGHLLEGLEHRVGGKGGGVGRLEGEQARGRLALHVDAEYKGRRARASEGEQARGRLALHVDAE
jgi:hypothetical protein